MFKYFLGLTFNLFHRGISILSFVDINSKISKKARVYYGTKIVNSTIASYTYIGPMSEIVHAEIGKFCSIAKYVNVGLARHNMKVISTSPIFLSPKNATGYKWVPRDSFQEFSKVIIGNDVWIGTKVMIMGGVKIGDGAVIGAGSIVTKNIPAYAVVAGVPAKILKFRFDNSIIENLNEIKWWELPVEKLRKNLKVFQDENFGIQELKSII